MLRTVVLLVVLVVYVHAGIFDCDAKGQCRPGMRCLDGTCVARLDCPQRGIPVVKPGCRLKTVVDSRGCPKTKTVCRKMKSMH